MLTGENEKTNHTVYRHERILEDIVLDIIEEREEFRAKRRSIGTSRERTEVTDTFIASNAMLNLFFVFLHGRMFITVLPTVMWW